MKLKKILSLALATLFSLPSLHASEHFKKAAVTTLVAASVLSSESEREEKVIENRKGETFTFHGDGTVSVRDIFGNDLGVHLTNNDNPLSHQSIELVKEGEKSGVFVGLGLKGGCSLCFKKTTKRSWWSDSYEEDPSPFWECLSSVTNCIIAAFCCLKYMKSH